jgi:hypothetical protein
VFRKAMVVVAQIPRFDRVDPSTATPADCLTGGNRLGDLAPKLRVRSTVAARLAVVGGLL